MPRSNLIMDVGMHDGQDTAYYLSKGFDVVAVEANPELVERARERFAGEIAGNRLKIVPAAIAESPGTVRLAICDSSSIWSSLSSEFVERNERALGEAYRYVDVESVRFEDLLGRHGVPRYLKVDIEGYDMLCVRALGRTEDRPDFVSIESHVSSNHAPMDRVFDELAQLWTLGYRRFAYVDQAKHPDRRPPQPAREGMFAPRTFTENCSGLFGEELDQDWMSVGQALRRAAVIRAHHNLGGFGGRHTSTPAGVAYRAVRRGLRGTAHWYDLHARR